MNLFLKYLQALEFLAEFRNADWKFFQKKKGGGELGVSSAKDTGNKPSGEKPCESSHGAH